MDFLQQGREEWDIPHTLAVVYYALQIGKTIEGIDLPVVVTATWLHDIGYFGQFNGDSHQYQTVQDKKKAHMEKGTVLARTLAYFLKDFSKLERVRNLTGIF